MSLLAAIAEGETDLAEVFYLVAAILFAIAAFLMLTVQPRDLFRLLVGIGLTVFALGFVVL